MKRKIVLLVCICVLVVVAGIIIFCDIKSRKEAVFNGSRTGDNNHFEMDFTWLNTTYAHDLDMKQGESIHVYTEKKSGEIKIVIKADDGKAIYEGNGDVASEFVVAIPEDGIYTISVTGKKAAGYLKFNIE